MGEPQTVRYLYARRRTGEVVSAEELTRDSDLGDEVLECIGCGRPMIAVLGKQRRKHFRHRVEIECTRETYLHKLGKALFQQVYSHCLTHGIPFTIGYLEWRQCTRCSEVLALTCKLPPHVRRFDLTRYFREMRLESRVDGLVPDLLLITSHGEPLFIEIAVTHLSTESKCSEGYRLIELRVKDEDDLQPIRQRLLIEEQGRVEFFNFRRLRIGNFEPECTNRAAYFILYENGKSAIAHETPPIFEREARMHPYAFYQYLPEGGGPGVYRAMVEKAYREGRPIRNCFLCRYHGDNFKRDEDGRSIYCKFLKTTHNSNQAAGCSYYRPDPKVFTSQSGLQL